MRSPILGPIGAILLAATIAAPAGSQPMPPPPPPPAGAPAFDPAQLPETCGIVGRYALSPRGDVEGVILQDGTQVLVPPHLGAQLVFLARPGEPITVRGLRALGTPLVAAVSVRNDASGQQIIDRGGPRDAMQTVEAKGTVQTVLRGRRAEVNGVILADGTTIRLAPDEAGRFAELLRPGQTVAARGGATATPFGTVIEAWSIGPAPERMTELSVRGPRERPRPKHR